MHHRSQPTNRRRHAAFCGIGSVVALSLSAMVLTAPAQATPDRPVQTSPALVGPAPASRAAVAGVAKASGKAAKPRIIAMEDAEVDDMDSFIRLLYYSNEFDIAGIVATSSKYHYRGDLSEGGKVAPFRWTGTTWVNRDIDLYDSIRPNLKKHASGWPTASHLRSVYKIGNVNTVSDTSHATEGSKLIEKRILDDDERPLYALAWGGTNTLARALQDIQARYEGTKKWPAIQAKVSQKLVVYNILTQDDTLEGYIKPSWPNVKIINNGGQFWGFAYAWNAVTPAPLRQFFSAPYMEDNFLRDTGPLMEQEYRTFGDGNPVPGELESEGRYDPAKIGSQAVHDFISEGDSPSFLYLVNSNGLRSSEDPTFGGWGGRFTETSSGWADTPDTSDPYSTGTFNQLTYAQLRWLGDIQNDFAGRVAWGTASKYSKANHAPTASVKGALDRGALAGEKIKLVAKAKDPDKDHLSYTWSEYTDADSYAGTTPIAITDGDSRRASLTIPADAKSGDTLHIILKVTDDGTPALTHYQRVIITVAAQR
jgi:hypothetical protein